MFINKQFYDMIQVLHSPAHAEATKEMLSQDKEANKCF